MGNYINGTYVNGREVIVNGKRLPKLPSKCKNITVIDGNVFIDGYEFKNEKWQRTIRALWYLLLG